ncbi:MAG: hypothetical protein PWP48_140 [Clostridiales bacterium]|nr:hypothetical protein [Clostridiales bacterium]
MSDTVIAAQLYTVREFTKTPEYIAETMKKVREIGYKAVQLSALGPIDVNELKKILDAEGLMACASHVSLEEARDQTDKVIEEHKILGCKYVAIAALPADYRNAEGYHRFAKEAAEIGKKFAAAGLVLGYHNHSFELEKFNGKTGLDIIYDESDPEYLTGEIDTYWIQHGGAEPAVWIRKLKGRMPLVHFKDMGIVSGQQTMFEVGEGNLNWSSILDACKETGVLWYIVEQDICRRDPFESLAISLRNMQAMGLR